jgi:hypothetical protein
MADKEISQLTALAGASTTTSDAFVLVDVSDTSAAPSGTTKKITRAELANAVVLEATSDGNANHSKLLASDSLGNLKLNILNAAGGLEYNGTVVPISNLEYFTSANIGVSSGGNFNAGSNALSVQYSAATNYVTIAANGITQFNSYGNQTVQIGANPGSGSGWGFNIFNDSSFQASTIPAGGSTVLSFTNSALSITAPTTITGTLGTTSAITATANSLGTTSTDGLVITNTTAAASGSPQYSPRLHLHGLGYNTAASASSACDVKHEIQTASGASTYAAFGSYVISYSLAGGGYSNLLTFNGYGTATFASNVTTSSVQCSGGGSTFGPGAIAVTSTDAIAIANVTASSSGTIAQWSGRLRLHGSAWNGTASHTLDHIDEMQVTGAGGTSYSGSRVWSYSDNGGAYSTLMSLDGKTGRHAIGSQTATAILDVAASTTSNAALRLRAGSAPTSPNDGEIYWDGTHLYIYKGSSSSWLTIV